MREMDARAWLFRHGFDVEKDDNHFVARDLDRSVHVKMESGVGESTVTHKGTKLLLRQFELAELSTDKFGMLHGAGIDNYFIDLMNFGSLAPKWFPKRYEKQVRSAMADRARYDKDWACGYSIIEWGVRNGFERVAHRILRGMHGGAMTELEVGIDHLTMRVLQDDSRFSMRRTNYREAAYDIEQMLRGEIAPLDPEYPFWR